MKAILHSSMSHLKTVLRGFAMGVCDIIPGISGSTMALILGIYSRLLHAIMNFNVIWIVSYIRYHKSKDVAHKKEALEHWKRMDLVFLIPLLVGILSAIVAGAFVLTYLFEVYAFQTFAFFSGLIIMSSFLMFHHVKKITTPSLLFLALGLVVGLGLLFLRPTSMPVTFLTVYIGGFVAALAMILPGISGSYVLLLLGLYEPVLGFIKTFDFEKLFFFGFGFVIGVFIMSRIVAVLLDRHHSQTLLFLIGLVFGSVFILLTQIQMWSIFVVLFFIAGLIIPIVLHVVGK
jgi:putative membrane protein